MAQLKLTCYVFPNDKSPPKVQTLRVSPNATTDDLSCEINSIFHYEQNKFVMVFHGEVMRPGVPIALTGITSDDVISCYVSLVLNKINKECDPSKSSTYFKTVFNKKLHKNYSKFIKKCRSNSEFHQKLYLSVPCLITNPLIVDIITNPNLLLEFSHHDTLKNELDNRPDLGYAINFLIQYSTEKGYALTKQSADVDTEAFMQLMRETFGTGEGGPNIFTRPNTRAAPVPQAPPVTQNPTPWSRPILDENVIDNLVAATQASRENVMIVLEYYHGDADLALERLLEDMNRFP